MPYVGNKPEVGNFRKCDAITTSATATYNLLVGGVAVNPNQNQCIVSLNGVIQSSGNSYTIASSQITFASALTSSDVIDFILILGDTLDVGVPSDDTVDASKITANIITGQSALGTTPADTDELLISDAGTLKRVDYSYLKSTVVNRINALPIIINGDFNVEQRKSASSTGWTSLPSGTYVNKDRWKYIINDVGTWTIGGGAAGKTDYGFAKSLWLDNTTPDASLAAASLLAVVQPIEAQNCKIFNWGTSRAEKITVGFWVKATKTGTYIVELLQADSDRICCQSYTVSSTDTWEFKVLNYGADTSGSVNDDTGSGLELRFYLAAGTNYTSGTLATTWAARSNTNRAVGQVNAADADCNWQISGVQMEVGEYTSANIPPFQHESFGKNLSRCQRYYYKTTDMGTAVGTAEMGNITNSSVECSWSVPTTMRTEGTVTIHDSTGTTNKVNYYSGGWQTGGSVNAANKQGESTLHVNSANASWNANLYVDCEL